MGTFNQSDRQFDVDVTVERGDEVGQLLIGFNDGNGNFVEIGRLSKTANDVTEPLEIEHQNSGERITLDSSGFGAQTVNNDYLYAASFAGGDADARLSSAVAEASFGDVILLENKRYSDDITISKRISLRGTLSGGRTAGTHFKQGVVTLNNRVHMSHIGFDENISTGVNSEIIINDRCVIDHVISSAANLKITVSSGSSMLTSLRGCEVVFDSSSDQCIIDSSLNTSVTDNGTNNVIGDIA
jgi:hypothetical protein